MEQHLESRNDRLPESMAEILRRMTLSLRGPTVSKAKELIGTSARSIFAHDGFQLHKWHSNAPELERDSQKQPAESEDSYAKLQLGSASVEGNKLLGLAWLGQS